MQKQWEEALTAVENPTYEVYSRLCTQGMYTKYFAQVLLCICLISSYDCHRLIATLLLFSCDILSYHLFSA
jgi:hypothetical protein